MKGVRRQTILPCPPERAWKCLEDIGLWDRMMQAFAGASGLRHELAPASHRQLAAGAELILKDRKGRALIRWKVAEWTPPRRLALAGHVPGRIGGFQASLELELTPQGQGPAKAEVGFVLIMENLVLEVLTLLLPVRWMYARRIDGMLKVLKASVR